jgi:hypothetical protein
MYSTKFSLTGFKGLYFFCAAVRFPYPRRARGDAPEEIDRHNVAATQRRRYDHRPSHRNDPVSHWLMPYQQARSFNCVDPARHDAGADSLAWTANKLGLA